MDPKYAGKPLSALHFGRSDIDQMPDTPNRGGRHRRAHSETFFRLPDDNFFNDVLADFSFDAPSLSSDDANPSSAVAAIDSAAGAEMSQAGPVGLSPHFRSLSVGDDFFQGLDFTPGGSGDYEKTGGRPPVGSQLHRHHRRHSSSMDGSTSSFEAESSSSMALDGVRKSMAPNELAELSLVDPKRAKRILANRLSAAKSKERKIRYTNELERKVQTLQIETTTLSAQIINLQKDASGLNTENRELKLRLQAMEKQANLQQALREAMLEEVQQLRIAFNQVVAIKESPYYPCISPQFYNLQILEHRGDNQTQQSHQQQLHISMNK